jgi:hypothetical protein
MPAVWAPGFLLRRRLEPLSRTTSPLGVPPVTQESLRIAAVLSCVHWVQPSLSQKSPI